MKNKISTTIIIIFSLFVSVLGPNTAWAEYRVIDPSNFAKEKTAVLFLSEALELPDGRFKIKLMVDTGGQSANALLASLHFSNDIINIEELNIDNSICDLFIENAFDNEQGFLNIICGKPFPGFNESSEVAEITFTKKIAGETNFIFTEAMILANDGYGTDILLEAKDKNIIL